MSILVDRDTRVLVQGITGREGSFHTEQMVEYGTNVVSGVTPGGKGKSVAGAPVFDTVADAVAETAPNVAIISCRHDSPRTPSTRQSTMVCLSWSVSPRGSPSRTWFPSTRTFRTGGPDCSGQTVPD